MRRLTVWAFLMMVPIAACSDGSMDGTMAEAGDMSSSAGTSGEPNSGPSAQAGEGGAGGSTAELSAGASESGAGESAPSEVQGVSISFVAMVGAEPFACDGTYEGLGTGGATLTPQDLRFFVHDVRLVRGDGSDTPVTLDDSDWQNGDVALLDFEDASGTCDGTPETNEVVVGTVPIGDYVGISFELGVPDARNHEDPTAAPPPLDVTGMVWSWNAGHKFLRADMLEDSRSELPFYFVQLGSSLCTGDASSGETVQCERTNRPRIELASFDPESQAVAFDYAALVAGADVGTDAGGAPGCMSDPGDPECPGIFATMGLDFDTGEPSTGQTIFSVTSL